MRVLFVTHNFPSRPGDAAGSFLLRLARALAEAGADVHVIAPAAMGGTGDATVEGIPVTRFRYAPREFETLAHAGTMAEQVRASLGAKLALGGMLAAGAAAVAQADRRHRPEVIHAHWWFPAGTMAWMARAAARAPLVTTMHGSDIRLVGSGGLGARALGAVLGASANTTTVSSWLADEVVRLTGAERPAVAPMPAAVELFAPGLPVGDRSGRLLFVGRLTAQKGIDVLLQALGQVRAPVSLDIVGDAADERQGAALRQRAADLGIAARVTWHGAVDQRSLAAFYGDAAALIVPSRDEGLGLVAVEAQLCETPVIAFDSGGLRDVVDHDRTGLRVEGTDARSLAGAIDALLDRPDRGAALGRAGRQAALARFAPGAVAQRYLGVYQDAIDRSER